MHPLATVLAAAAIAAVTSVVVVRQFPPEPVAAPGSGAEIEALRREIAELRRDRTAPEPVAAAAPASATPGHGGRAEVPTVSDERIAAAVERYLQQRGRTGGEASAATEVDAKTAFDELATASTANFWENTDLYKKLFEAGKLEEVLAMFEARAKANPNDPDAQMDAGNAYLAALQLEPAKWQLSMQADAAFDRVLAIDDTHWEARFTKAMSYTFWPDFLGKKKEAISHFEKLVAQQDTMPPQPHHAQTYLYLGNILEQRGQTERAQEIWRRGLRLHPNSKELQQRTQPR